MEQLLEYVCPYDKSALEKTSDSHVCPNCAKLFPIKDGIPNFLSHVLDDESENYLEVLDEWGKNDAVDYGDPFRNAIEIPHVLRLLGSKPGDLVLDAACGKGRVAFPWISRADVRLVGLDFSQAALTGMRKRTPATASVQLAKADIACVPFLPGQFDGVLALGLLPCLPTENAIDAVLQGLKESLKPGGTLVISAVNWSDATRAIRPKIGYRAGSPKFLRMFDYDEFGDWLSRYFEVVSIDCLIHQIPKVTTPIQQYAPAGIILNRWVDIMFRRTPWARGNSWLLVGKCRLK